MWLSSGASGTSTSAVLEAAGALATVFAMVVTGLLTFRSSNRNTDVEREKNFDARNDAELAYLRARCAAQEQAIDRLSTKLLRARVILSRHDISPDEIEDP